MNKNKYREFPPIYPERRHEIYRDPSLAETDEELIATYRKRRESLEEAFWELPLLGDVKVKGGHSEDGPSEEVRGRAVVVANKIKYGAQSRWPTDIIRNTEVAMAAARSLPQIEKVEVFNLPNDHYVSMLVGPGGTGVHGLPSWTPAQAIMSGICVLGMRRLRLRIYELRVADHGDRLRAEARLKDWVFVDD